MKRLLALVAASALCAACSSTPDAPATDVPSTIGASPQEPSSSPSASMTTLAPVRTTILDKRKVSGSDRYALKVESGQATAYSSSTWCLVPKTGYDAARIGATTSDATIAKCLDTYTKALRTEKNVTEQAYEVVDMFPSGQGRKPSINILMMDAIPATCTVTEKSFSSMKVGDVVEGTQYADCVAGAIEATQ